MPTIHRRPEAEGDRNESPHPGAHNREGRARGGEDRVAAAPGERVRHEESPESLGEREPDDGDGRNGPDRPGRLHGQLRAEEDEFDPVPDREEREEEGRTVVEEPDEPRGQRSPELVPVVHESQGGKEERPREAEPEGPQAGSPHVPAPPAWEGATEGHPPPSEGGGGDRAQGEARPRARV